MLTEQSNFLEKIEIIALNSIEAFSQKRNCCGMLLCVSFRFGSWLSAPAFPISRNAKDFGINVIQHGV